MSPLLLTLAEISLSMSAVILLLLLLGPLLERRYQPRWRYWAWLAVSVRLLIPWNPDLPHAPVQVAVPPADQVVLARPTPAAPAVDAAGPVSAPPTAPMPDASSPPASAPAGSAAEAIPAPQPAEQQTAWTLRLDTVLTALWAGGCIVLLAWHGLGLLRFRHYLRRWSRPLSSPSALAMAEDLTESLGLTRRPEIRICPGVESPMLAGLFRPVILLPEELPEEPVLWFALRHELCHYKRRDIWYKALLLLANILHWYNPLVWLMRAAAGQDVELSCDASTVAGLDSSQRAAYGQAIVSTLGRSLPAPERS